MSKWSGVGIPPTRRKLHKLRQKLVLERKADRKAERAEAAALDASFRHARRAIINEERFIELWVPPMTRREALLDLTRQGQALGLYE